MAKENYCEKCSKIRALPGGVRLCKGCGVNEISTGETFCRFCAEKRNACRICGKSLGE